MDKDYEKRTFAAEENFWWYIGRRDLIRKLAIPPKAKILEIGCGSGLNLAQWSDCERTGVDFSDEALDLAKGRGIRTVKADLETELPFEDETFDYIFALDIIEHLDRDKEVVERLSKLLKPNGALVIHVPAFRMLWSNHDVLSMHRRRYRLWQIKELADKNHLRIERLSYWNTALFIPIMAIIIFKRLLNIQGSNIIQPSKAVNNALLNILRIENKAIFAGIRLPFGTSVFFVGRK